MPHPAQDLLATRRVYAGRVLNVEVDTVRAPDGSTIDLEVVRHAGAAAVVPLIGDLESVEPQVLLIQQYRYAAGGHLWEIPAGILEPGETPVACAHRELLEETGARAGGMEQLTTILPSPGFNDEQIHLFLATGLSAGEPNHERDEFIEVRTRTMTQALTMIRDGEIRDGKTIAALLFVAGFRLNL